MRVIMLLLSVWVCSGCVPMALYNYATHDVEEEAKASDCARGIEEACKK